MQANFFYSDHRQVWQVGGDGLRSTAPWLRSGVKPLGITAFRV